MHDLALSAEEVASKEFPISFRGFDQHEVRAFLAQVAAELAVARERERLQRHRLEAAEARAASRVLTDEEIEAALGHEAGRVLHAAREAAREIRARAEEQVARLVREASGEGSRAEQEAESLLARRSEEAERVAAEILAEARRKAESELERAKAEGRQMVGEAQAVRERVLKDLARRRKAAHQHLEQLRAGRERLLEAYRVVRATLDEATSELSVAEAEARAAAETAALRVGSQPEASVEELEAELSAARDLGLGPLRSPAARSEHGGSNGHGASNGNAMLSSAPVIADRLADEPGPEPAPVVVALPTTPGPDDAPPDRGGEQVETVDEQLDEHPGESVEADEHPGESVEADEYADGYVDEQPDESGDADEYAHGYVDEQPDEPGDEQVEAVEEPADDREAAVAEPVGDEPETALSSSEAPDEREGPSGREVEELFARLREEARAHAEIETEPEPADGGEPVTAVDAGPGPGVEVDDEVLLQHRDVELEPVERTLVKSLKRTLADEQNEVLDTLRRRRGLVSLAELLPGASDHTARYLAIADPVLATAARLGTGGVGEPPSVTDLAVDLAATVVDDLRARLQRVLEAADGDESALAEGTSSAYREWKTARVEPLARHHTAAAHTRGRFAMALEGNLRWVVDGEEGPCPDCDDNALAVTAKGEPFPTGQRHPPAHLGCRCTIVGAGS